MSDAISKAVFLSYASQDAEAAKRICDALRAAGVEVWFDQSELRGGDAWDQQIRRQIKECALFVPIISSNTQARGEGYFRLEWRLADQRTHLMGRNRAFLIPVCVDQTPDANADIPDSFAAVQWTRLIGGETPAAFVERVRKLLPSGPVSASTASSAPAPISHLPSPSDRPAADLKSVAVLAFANLSNDQENEYFSDGISEELLNVLAKVKGLKVSARTSAFYFKGKQVSIAEIARQLGVAYVVEGSVRKAGERVRITAQLIKAADGFHVWSDTFTRDLKDIFAVQDEIAGLIAQNLQLKLGESVRVSTTVNPEAYRLFLQGRAVVNREIPEDYAKAIRYFKDSLALDETSALNWSWLAMTYIFSAAQGMMMVTDGFGQAREAALRAIALDPLLASGHGALGCVMFAHDWDWVESERVLQKAAALAPGDATTVCFLAQIAQTTGRREQAIELGRKALELDPLSNLAGYVMGKSLFQAGRLGELEKLGEHMVGLNPTGFYGWVFQIYARVLLGRFDEAAQAVEQIPRGFYRDVGLALVRHAQGRSAEADAALNEIKAKFGVHGAYQIAEVHAFRREIEPAFEWLEIAYRQRDPGMTWLIHDPFLADLHQDPRWADYMRKMKLTYAQSA
jgi:TolB-like protein